MITRDANHEQACNHVHKNLPTGIYTASVYASYPDGTNTQPVFVTDSKGEVVKFRVESVSLSAKFAYATSSTLAFTWSASGFKDAAKDL